MILPVNESMNVIGPARFALTLDENAYKVTCSLGKPRFSGIATLAKPKLYIVSVGEEPVYIGITKQSICRRLRLGFKPDKKSGYDGYAWRYHLTTANLDIWCHENPSCEPAELDMETVEAEIVFLIRAAGNWPKHQTEIHFHPSTQEHRDLAKSILARYRLLGVA